MKNRIEDLIEDYLLNEEALDEGKKLDALLDLSKIIRRAGARGSKKGIEGIAWFIDKSYDAISLYVANSIEASAHVTSLNKIGKVKAQNKKMALLQDKAEQYKRQYVHTLMDIEKELQRKK